MNKFTIIVLAIVFCLTTSIAWSKTDEVLVPKTLILEKPTSSISIEFKLTSFIIDFVSPCFIIAPLFIIAISLHNLSVIGCLKSVALIKLLLSVLTI